MPESCLTIDRIRRAHFVRDNSEISPAGVFNALYSPMDDLVARNVRACLGPRHKLEHYQNSPEFQKLVAETERAVSSLNGHMSAVLQTETGKEIHVPIRPRTNYDALSIKRPNIAFLGPLEGGLLLVLREARAYSGNQLMFKEAAARYAGHFKVDDYDNLGLGGAAETVEQKDIILLPETPLVLALESLYLNSITPRLTPKLKVVGVDGRNLWALRSFLPALKDVHFDLPAIVANVASFQGLGLLDCLDGKSEHYCFESGRVVNIDPDFQCYSAHGGIIDHFAFGDFKQKILPDFLKNPRREDINHLRRRIMEEVGMRLAGRTILDYLPRKVNEASILGALKTENAEIK